MPPSKKRKLASDASVMSNTQTEKNATASEEPTAGCQAPMEEPPSEGNSLWSIKPMSGLVADFNLELN